MIECVPAQDTEPAGRYPEPMPTGDFAFYRDVALATVRKIRNIPTQDREDLVQETMLKLIVRGGVPEPSEQGITYNPAGYVTKALYGEHFRQLQQYNRRNNDAPIQGYISTNHGSLAHHETPESITMKQEEAKAVIDAIDSLPEEFREVVRLRGEGYTTREVADLLDIPENTVSTRFHRGRARVRVAMKVM